MSHFTVMVVGKDYEEALAPYDENLEDAKVPKWDWYALGGRWDGYLLLKDGIRASQARKGDVDFEAMKAEAREKAAKEYDEYTKVTAPYEKPRTFESIREEFKDNIAEARNRYYEQPAVKALNEAGIVLFFGDVVETFGIPREEYIENAAKNAISTFAFLDAAGNWHERGEMGWWAMVSNEKPESEWRDIFERLLAEVPDDEILSIVDCHI